MRKYNIFSYLNTGFLKRNLYKLFYMKILLLLALIAISTFAQQPGCCDRNSIKVRGNAQVKVKPDFATINIGVNRQQTTTSAALQSLNQKIDQLISIIRQQGIQENDYSTSSFTIQPVNDYQAGESILIGQRASQILTVKIRNLQEDGAAIGALIDAASAIGDIVVEGVSFDQSDRTLGVKDARKAAFEAARKKAQQYAKLSGLRLARVLRIESTDPGRFIPFRVNANSFAGDFKTLVPVRDVIVQASVQVAFSISP